jgi:3-hydroxyacyl-[acyl-carrier-protein] dehydratase
LPSDSVATRAAAPPPTAAAVTSGFSGADGSAPVPLSLPLETRHILNILPHRYPFLLVDRVTELEPGQRVVATKSVTINEPFFPGHFPGHPIMPGVLIVEMMAQVGGIMMLTIPEHRGKIAYLAGVEKTRFRKPVLPGDTLIATVTLARARGNVGWVKAQAHVAGHARVRIGNLLFAD